MHSILSSLLLVLGSGLILGSSATALKVEEPASFFGGSDYAPWWSWYKETAQHKYDHVSYFGQDDSAQHGAAVHWSLTETHVELAVAVRATGWLSFGLSENGGMRGADLLIFQAKDPKTVMDAHIQHTLQPIQDTCNNWQFVNSIVEDDFLIVQARREIDTNDLQDRPLVYDATFDEPASLVIAAWGDSEQYTYHGASRSRGNIRWYADPEEQTTFPQLMQQADGYFEIKAGNHHIRADTDTEYANFCFSWDDIVAQGIPEGTFSVIGMETIVDKAEHLHHHVVLASDKEMNGVPCEEYSFDDFKENIDVWAKGGPPLPMPQDVGLSIGENGYKSFRLEIHYDNPQFKNTTDNSGVRFYYVKEQRPQEVGFLRLGDIRYRLRDQQIGDGVTQHDFYCPGSCSNIMLQQDVTVFRENIHMHALGRSGYSEVIRNDQVIHTGTVDYFDFDQQGNQIIQTSPYTLKKGDAIRTVCNYDTASHKNATFGKAAENEMCIGYLIYYPKQSFLNGILPWMCGYELGFEQCENVHTATSLDQVPRLFGTTMEEGECPEMEPYQESSAATDIFRCTACWALLATAHVALQIL